MDRSKQFCAYGKRLLQSVFGQRVISGPDRVTRGYAGFWLAVLFLPRTSFECRLRPCNDVLNVLPSGRARVARNSKQIRGASGQLLTFLFPTDRSTPARSVLARAIDRIVARLGNRSREKWCS